MRTNNLFKLIIILSVFSLIGCKDTISRAEHDIIVYEKDQKISELEEKVSALEEHIANLEVKTQEVNSQFERLKNENWREVVPEANSALDELNNEIGNDPTSNY